MGTGGGAGKLVKEIACACGQKEKVDEKERLSTVTPISL